MVVDALFGSGGDTAYALTDCVRVCFRAAMGRTLSEWFWNPDIWLPPNVTWADIKSNETVKYAEFEDLYHPIPMAFLFLVIRFFVER